MVLEVIFQLSVQNSFHCYCINNKKLITVSSIQSLILIELIINQVIEINRKFLVEKETNVILFNKPL